MEGLTFRNHPLSIEAIFPTAYHEYGWSSMLYVTILCQSRLFSPPKSRVSRPIRRLLVTILCQSRLFSPRVRWTANFSSKVSNHPLSIEAIFPTGVIKLQKEFDWASNHHLSIEAIFPTR